MRVRLAALALPVVLAGCNLDGDSGYVEIKAVPPSPQVALYIDTVKLEPLRNGNALLRQKVGTAKLQVDGDGGHLAVLCSIEVRKDRITSVTVSLVPRASRCQCGRPAGTDAAASRTCIG